MIIVIAFILNLLAPIINILGVIGLYCCYTDGATTTLILSAVMAVVGFIFGIFAYGNDIPPRWFWSRSANELFSFSVTAVLGYAFNFASWPTAIYLIKSISDKF